MNAAATKKKKGLFSNLYFQVLGAIACGVLLGHFAPETAVAMKPLGDGFIKLIKMMIGPIIFCTVVGGMEATGTTTGPGAAGRTGTGVAGAANSRVLATTGVTPDVARVGCTALPRSRCAPAKVCGVTTSARAATG